MLMTLAEIAYERAAELGAGVHRSRHHAKWWMGALEILFHNIAVAGALCAAYAQGRADGVEDGRFLGSIGLEKP